MKVTTDGVLLGAWQCNHMSKNVLDIGTGTGVIALMIAQGNTTAQIDAIDIDADAYLQAKENFTNSPWSNRLTAIHTPLQDFATGKQYDLVVSNPPYFVNDSHAPSHQRNIARHGVTLTYSDLLAGIGRLLSGSGRALLIIPIANVPVLQELAATYGLYITARTEVVAVTGKPPYVVLLQLERNLTEPVTDTLVIKDTGGVFTDEYKTLTAGFYLAF
jgi:tRNA1Val (adenine37-N6)-methyltransferase